MYRCPPTFDDGVCIDFRSEGESLESILPLLKSAGIQPDICLVDGWHMYHCAARDIRMAFELLTDGGMLVVHDCLPLTHEEASPQFVPGAWSGVTYRAFLDFVLARDDLDYVTVNIDYGCGIIVKNRKFSVQFAGISTTKIKQAVDGWFRVSENDDQAFTYFRTHYASLLKLTSRGRFFRSIAVL